MTNQLAHRPSFKLETFYHDFLQKNYTGYIKKFGPVR